MLECEQQQYCWYCHHRLVLFITSQQLCHSQIIIIIIWIRNQIELCLSIKPHNSLFANQN